jgi:Zn-dependent protease with chaperone function
MQREWRGHYLDGQTAISYPATVRLMQEGLEVTAAGWSRLWPYRELRQTQGAYEGEEVRIERGGELPEAVVVADQAFLSSLSEAAPRLAPGLGAPARRGQRLRLIGLAAAATVGLVGALYLWGIPALAALVAPRVPVAWEERLGASVVTHLAPPEQVCTDARRQQALAAVLARLVAAAPASPYRFRLIVVNRPEVNALATPGGNIVVFRGLLERTRTPEELAGVLAHEVEHVLHRHTTRALIQHVSTGLLVAAVSGDMTGPLAYGLESARVLGQLQYSRHAEEEADAEGMRLLLAARIRPDGMIGFFEALAGKDQERSALRYLSTHPSARDRIGRLRALAAGAAAPALPLLPDQDWSDLRSVCPSGAPSPAAPSPGPR